MKCNLKSGWQCRKATKTANSVLSQFSRAFHYTDQKTFVKVYKLEVHIWNMLCRIEPWTKAKSDVLEKVQKRAVSMVPELSTRGGTKWT
jgi:hypothetical protein